MKKSVTDRRYPLLLGWPAYFLMYYLTERLIRPENCHLIHCALDDLIPFCELFAVFYVGWYALLAGSLLYFFLRSPEDFVRLQTYIITVQLLATVIYIVYPSYQDLRPTEFPRENVQTAVMGLLYRIDTPTGVFPSLHGAISLGIASVWLRKQDAKSWLKGLISLFCLGVCLSVVFVKQHSVLDIAAAVPICLVVEWFVFGREFRRGGS